MALDQGAEGSGNALGRAFAGSLPADAPPGEGDGAPAAQLVAVGATCATLTPRIGAAIRALASGQVLEVVVDDPEAEEGLRSWSRLTGHTVLGQSRDQATATVHYFLRRA